MNRMIAESPTPEPEVNSLLHDLVSSARTILGDNFIGAYLQGSFTVGDWDRDSDVDFIIALDHDVPDAQLPALQAMHGRIYDRDSTWAKHLEGSYFPKDILRRDPARSALLFLDNTFRELTRSNHCNTLVVRWCVRERGIILAGPHPRELIDVVEPEDLRTEVRATMEEWALEIFAHPEHADNRWFQPYAVLTYCRMLHTLQTGRVESKLAGSRWAADALDRRWAGLIQRAWKDRPDPSFKVRQPADPDDLRLTFDFIAYTLEVSRRDSIL